MLANEAVEHAVLGPLAIDHLGQGKPYRFQKIDVPIRGLPDVDLTRLSKEGQLALNVDEMRTIQAHFAAIGRDPTDCELETIAQTWSEHCSHKTLKGRIDFDGEIIDNLLKQTVFKATQDLALDWLVSVFSDNAGVVRFDDDFDVCFKVETHNHPSAIDPYGGLEHRARRRDPRHPGDRPRRRSRSPTPTSSAWPRRIRRPRGSRPASSTPGACWKGSSPASAITATAWASPPSTAPWPSILATSRIPSSSAARSA